MQTEGSQRRRRPNTDVMITKVQRRQMSSVGCDSGRRLYYIGMYEAQGIAGT